MFYIQKVKLLMSSTRYTTYLKVQNLRVESIDRPKNNLYGDVPETEADDAWNVGDRPGKLGGAQTA